MVFRCSNRALSYVEYHVILVPPLLKLAQRPLRRGLGFSQEHPAMPISFAISVARRTGTAFPIWRAMETFAPHHW